MTATAKVDHGERAILSPDDDSLDRGAFVKRLARALITDDGLAARGVVAAVTGSWGSGKSSVLNLVALELKTRNPKAIVVRFDPWVISGQQDLILSFLRDTIRTVADEPANAQAARKVIKGLKTYAAHLAPMLDLAHKGLGGAIRGFFEGLGIFIAGDESLAGQRSRLQQLLGTLQAPIVVLIDELDRVEDEEVRSVAQLVRAVGDFEGISYLLAYDPRRVARALGGGRDAEAETHGRAYLEKIVQLPLALPVALPDELRRMLDAEVRRVLKALDIDEQVLADPRYQTIADAITPNLAATPRDIKRLAGVFHPLAAMVRDEVDLVDVLGCAALMAKAPRSIENLMRDPEAVIDDPLDFREMRRRVDRQTGAPGPLLPVVVPEEEASARPLVMRLFPALVGRQAEAATHANPVSRRRGLMTVMRLGLLPGALSSEETVELLSAPAGEVAERLAAALQKGKIGDLLNRLNDLYPSRFKSDDLQFWLGAATMLNASDGHAEYRFMALRSLSDSLAAMLATAVARQPDLNDKAERILNELHNDLMIAPRLLLDHLMIHGLGANGQVASRPTGGAWFLSGPETVRYVRSFTDRWRTEIPSGHFLEKLNSPDVLYIMVRLDVWDDACRSRLKNDLPQIVAQMAVLMFAPNHSTSPEIIERLSGAANFVESAEFALRSTTLSDLERTALTKAINKLRSDESEAAT